MQRSLVEDVVRRCTRLRAIVGIRVVAVACKATIREDVEMCVALAVGLMDGTHRLGRPAWHGRLLNNDLRRRMVTNECGWVGFKKLKHTQGGQEWLGTEGAKEWLETESAKEWLDIETHNTVTQTRLRRPAKVDNVPIKTGQLTSAHGGNCTMIYEWAEV